MNIFTRIKRFLFGFEVTPEEREKHRQEMLKRKAYILGAGTGSAMKSDDDGVVRIRNLSDGDNSVCDKHNA